MIKAHASVVLDDPNWWPATIQRGLVGFLELQDFDETLRASSFLHLPSIRGLTGRAADVPLAMCLAHEKKLGTAPHAATHVFHVGNVGSTLCANVIERVFRRPVLREPGILRLLAVNAFQAEAAGEVESAAIVGDLAQALVNRWARLRRGVVIKHTSLSMILAEGLSGNSPASRTAFVTTSARHFIGHALSSAAAARNIFFNQAELLAFARRHEFPVEQIDFSVPRWAAGLKWAVLTKMAARHPAFRVIDFDAVGDSRSLLLDRLAEVVSNDNPVRPDDLSHSTWEINPKTGSSFSFEQRRRNIDRAYAEHGVAIDEVAAWASACLSDDDAPV